MNEGAGATFRIALNDAATSDMSVGFELAGAANAADLGTLPASPVTIAEGQRFVDVTVPTTDDGVDENDESLFLDLKTSPVTIVDARGTATIVDNDTAAITVSNITKAEGTGTGQRAFEFLIKMSGVSSTDVSVAWATSAESATAPEDFVTAGGVIRWSAGEDGGRTVEVGVVQDAATEPNETFTLRLFDRVGIAVITKNVGNATIVDDDPAQGPALSLSIADGVVSERASTIDLEVVLSDASQQPVTVKYAAQSAQGPSNATPGSDFTLAPGTLTFAPNETKKTLTVDITNDAATEPDETFLVALAEQTPSGVALAKGIARVTILNDDSGGSTLPVQVPQGSTPANVTTPIDSNTPSSKPKVRKKSLVARILFTRLAGRVDGLKRTAIRVTLNQKVVARIVFSQGKRTIRSAPFSLRAGNRTFYVLLPANVDPGRVDFRLQLTAADNRRKVLRSKLVLQA